MRREVALENFFQGELEQAQPLVGLGQPVADLDEAGILLMRQPPQGRQAQLHQGQAGPLSDSRQVPPERFDFGDDAGVFRRLEQLDLPAADLVPVVQDEQIDDGAGAHRLAGRLADNLGDVVDQLTRLFGMSLHRLSDT